MFGSGLHYASGLGSQECVRSLLAYGAEVDAKASNVVCLSRPCSLTLLPAGQRLFYSTSYRSRLLARGYCQYIGEVWSRP